MADQDEPLSRDEARQMILFDQWPEDPDLAERAARFLETNDPKEITDHHTGKRALQNVARCRRIIEALLADAPKRVIMREFKVGFKTMTRIWEAWEKSGRMKTVKDRLSAGWGEIGLITQHKIREALLDGTMPKNVLPALGGIATDKHALLTGSATERIELKREVTVAEVEDAWARLQAARGQVIDAEVVSTEADSEEPRKIPSKSSATPFPDTKPDTGQAPDPAGVDRSRGADQDQPAGREDQAAHPAPDAKRGGGGRANAAGGSDSMGLPSKFLDPKDDL